MVSPIYNGALLISDLVIGLSNTLDELGVSYEIILIDDGSADDSWNKIENLTHSNPYLKGVKLSRNFGQHYAVTAGLEYSTGERIIIIDSDLQDELISISKLISKANEGYDIIFTRRAKRKHGLFKRVSALIYNKMFSLFAGKSYGIDLNSLVCLNRKAANAYLKLSDFDRLYIQMLQWIGFKSTIVEVQHRPRAVGKSTYTFWSLLKIAIQGWTFHSDKLLRYSILGGFTLSAISIFVSLLVVVLYFIDGFQPGWPSLFLAILFTSGLILMSIGVTGIYIGKIFTQVKNRPLFLVEELTFEQ